MKRIFNDAMKYQDGSGVERAALTESKSPKLGWTLEELAHSLSVSVPPGPTKGVRPS